MDNENSENSNLTAGYTELDFKCDICETDKDVIYSSVLDQYLCPICYMEQTLKHVDEIIPTNY